jgi:hypothetical protein
LQDVELNLEVAIDDDKAVRLKSLERSLEYTRTHCKLTKSESVLLEILAKTQIGLSGSPAHGVVTVSCYLERRVR